MRQAQPSRIFRAARQRQAGMTLLELVIACSILLLLATAAIPVARFTVKRQKEAELRRDLREMRDAIDRYKDAADKNQIRVEAGTEGYPPDLQTLVKGVDLSSQPGANPATAAGSIAGGNIAAGNISAGGQVQFGTTQFGTTQFGGNASTFGQDAIRHMRFLRKVPVDPMTGHAEWGMRSVQDDPDSSSWGGKDVFDVFSLSTGQALDGSKYSDW